MRTLPCSPRRRALPGIAAKWRATSPPISAPSRSSSTSRPPPRSAWASSAAAKDSPRPPACCWAREIPSLDVELHLLTAEAAALIGDEQQQMVLPLRQPRAGDAQPVLRDPCVIRDPLGDVHGDGSHVAGAERLGPNRCAAG